jgi:glycosyl transferase family 25
MNTDNINDVSDIYVINLESDKNRKEDIEKQFKKYNFNINFFNAIHGKSLNYDELQTKNIIDTNIGKIKKGEIGCALSHITLWKQLLNSSKQYFIIFEDDIILYDDFEQKLKNILHELKNKKWHIVFFQEYCFRYFPKEDCNGDKYTNNTIRPKNIGYGTQAYIINKDFVDKCLNVKPTLFPITKPIDVYMVEKQRSDSDIIFLRADPILVGFKQDYSSTQHIE